MSRVLKIIGLFCRISSLLQGSFAKETYHFKEPTNRSHPTCLFSILGATISRLIKIIALFCLFNRALLQKSSVIFRGLLIEETCLFSTIFLHFFCRIQSVLQGFFVKETYHFQVPTPHVFSQLHFSTSIVICSSPLRSRLCYLRCVLQKLHLRKLVTFDFKVATLSSRMSEIFVHKILVYTPK